MRTVKVHFLGASGTVTGSKYILETPESNLMIDCGVFQGLKELREHNWEDLPFDISTIGYVLLTHGHLDHVGYLPRLIKQGFIGKIIGTPPTLDIAEIILRDSAKIHEEEAERANKEGYSKHSPALPFFTLDEAEETLTYFKNVPKDEWQELSPNIKCRFKYNGHIIGATFIELQIFEKTFVFSGDIGRKEDLLLYPPEKPVWADYLFIESTYGDKLHPKEPIEEILINRIHETIHNGGVFIIPSFAVERLQLLMYILWQLYKGNHIPNIPIFIDSPMGNNVTRVFEQFPNWHRLEGFQVHAMKKHMEIIRSYRETWETIDDSRPKVVIAGSGMVTGGRVLTYLNQLIDEPTTSILLVGYQAEGTRGRLLLEGAHELRLFGKYYPVRASVYHLESLSAHADQADLLEWLSDLKNIPEQVFLVHGEPTAADAFRVKLEQTHKWNVRLPKLYDVVELMV